MRNVRGFTLVEMLVVVTVGVVLMSIVVNSMSGFQSRSAVRQARDVFLSMHARARAQAVEAGQTVELNVDQGGDSVWISRNDTALSIVRFPAELGVVIAGNGVHTLCLTARGFADPSCNSFATLLDVSFVQGADTAVVRILPLGQAIY